MQRVIGHCHPNRTSAVVRSLLVSATAIASLAASGVAAATPSYYISVYSDENTIGNSSYDGSILASPGLTSDSVNVGACGASTSGASAAASLAEGAVRACASGFGFNQAANSRSEIFDTLTFDVSGATNATTTDVGVRVHFDGVPTGPQAASQIQLRLAGSGLSGSTARPVFNHEATTPGTNNNPAAVLQDYASSWLSYSITNSGFGGVDFSGVFAVDGAAPQVTFDLWTNEAGQDGSASNFLSTGFLNLSLPTGTSFTSSSGTFLSTPLTVPAPEPSGLALLVTGVAGLIATRGRGNRLKKSRESGLARL